MTPKLSLSRTFQANMSTVDQECEATDQQRRSLLRSRREFLFEKAELTKQLDQLQPALRAKTIEEKQDACTRFNKLLDAIAIVDKRIQELDESIATCDGFLKKIKQRKEKCILSYRACIQTKDLTERASLLCQYKHLLCVKSNLLSKQLYPLMDQCNPSESELDLEAAAYKMDDLFQQMSKNYELIQKVIKDLAAIRKQSRELSHYVADSDCAALCKTRKGPPPSRNRTLSKPPLPK